jgi:nucleoside 2-deoxyribosyltransferase
MRRDINYCGPFRTGDGKDHDYIGHGAMCYYSTSEKIFARSVTGVESCDVFFALFEDKEAFGTLIELGVAYALKKKIVVGFISEVFEPYVGASNHGFRLSDHQNDLWFAAQCADLCLEGTRDQILKQFAAWLADKHSYPREQVLAEELSKATGKVVGVLYGDPLTAMHTDDGGGAVFFGPHLNLLNALKAPET